MTGALPVSVGITAALLALRQSQGDLFQAEGQLAIDPFDGSDAGFKVRSLQFRIEMVPEPLTKTGEQLQAGSYPAKPLQVQPGFQQPSGDLQVLAPFFQGLQA